MEASGFGGSSSSQSPTSLHDIVLDYITTQAYASTAQALSKPRSQSHSTTPRGPSTTNILDGDIEMNGSGGMGRTGNGNGNGHSMDVDPTLDTDIIVPPTSPKVQGKKGKGREMVLDEEALESIERRRDILNHILNGAIIRAVEAINTHFPSVLQDSSTSNPAETTSNGFSSSTNGSSSSSNTTQKYYSLLDHPHSHPSSISTKEPPLPHSLPVFSMSSLPAHVKLNLQIQQFIESFRQLSPPSNPGSPSSSIGSLNNGQTSMNMSMSMSIQMGMASTSTTNGNGTNNGNNGNPMTSSMTLTHALTAAQGLHSEAKNLKAEDRAIYLQEIKDVGALFAYTDPETSILKGFLEQSRRIALAEQVNRAILKSQGRPTQSILETTARRTHAIWTIMSERGIEPVPQWTGADGQGKEQLAAITKNMTSGGFSLREFVSHTWV